MAVAVTSSKITAFNTVTAVTANAATADTDALAEVFTITPSRPDYKGVLVIGGTGSAADGNITMSVAAGDLWASGAVAGTITKNTVKMIELEGGKVKQDDGTILVTLTPAATDKLLTNHAAYVYFIETL